MARARWSAGVLAMLLSYIVIRHGAEAEPVSDIKAGAARVDITPSAGELVVPFKRVADPIYVRALVVDSGAKRVVIVVADVPTIGADVAAELKQRIAQTAHTTENQIVLATTHTHNAMRVAHNITGIILPGSSQFVDRVTTATLEAVKQAEGRMQPARMGIGAGHVALTGNRNVWSPIHGRVIADVDRTGSEPVDHRLGVGKLETLNGRPIAFLLNHGFEPVVAMPIKDEISGDVPGAAARIIEERAGHDAVALFTIGAAGVPLYRSDDTPEASRKAHTLSLLNSMGTIFAEEALSVAATLPMSTGTTRIAAASKPLICPGKATTPFNLPDRCAYSADSTLPACQFVDRDSPPVALQIGVVRIGDFAIIQTDANIAPALAAKFQRSTPIANSWIVALTFGPMRFVVDDAAYKQNTYEATATTAKAGCAEVGYLDISRQLLAQTAL